MEHKSAVSVLQEYCAKNKVGPPKYEFSAGDNGLSLCKVTLLEMKADGTGRSKRAAKHLSALNLMRELRKLTEEAENGSGNALNGAGNDAKVDELSNLNCYKLEDAQLDELPNLNSDKLEDAKVDELINLNCYKLEDAKLDELTNPNRDKLEELRDYCVSHDLPLPVIEIEQESNGFIAWCHIASIKRYGKSDKKRDAIQRAASEMLRLIVGNEVRPRNRQKPIENLNKDAEAERRKKFKTYRELKETGAINLRSTKLCDRHNYFKSFYPHLKQAAFAVLNSKEYDSEKEQAEAVLRALKLDHRITQLDSNTKEPLVMLEILCDYDAVVVGRISQIHNRLIDYLRVMLL